LDVSALDYQPTSLKSRLISAISRRLDFITYRQRHGLIAGLRRRGGLGFLPTWLVGDSTDTPEHRFLAGLDVRGKVVYDVGAFYGLITLHFARNAKTVVAYEPTPFSRERVLQNVALNGFRNVIVRDVGVGSEPGELEFLVDRSKAGTATSDTALRRKYEKTNDKLERVRAAIVRLDDDVASGKVPPPDVVKIDTEGAELGVLRGMTNILASYRPSLYLEMHGADDSDKRARVAAIVSFLVQHGFGDIRHIESDTAITEDNAEVAREGHLFARAR
jgi:FkbM family methyltransferase